MLCKPSLRSLTITVAAAGFAVPALASPESKAMYQALAADYPLTQMGQVMFDTDYTRITKPGAILAVRLPGIYADVANTKDAIVNTNYADSQLTQATGFAAAFGSTTTHSRTMTPNEKVYVTQISVKKNAVQMRRTGTGTWPGTRPTRSGSRGCQRHPERRAGWSGRPPR